MVDVNFGVDVRARIRLTPVPLVLALCRRHSTSKLRAGWAKLSYGKLKKASSSHAFRKSPRNGVLVRLQGCHTCFCFVFQVVLS